MNKKVRSDRAVKLSFGIYLGYNDETFRAPLCVQVSNWRGQPKARGGVTEIAFAGKTVEVPTRKGDSAPEVIAKIEDAFKKEGASLRRVDSRQGASFYDDVGLEVSDECLQAVAKAAFARRR